MEEIKKVRSISIWIFIIPFIAVNTCLVLITTFHDLFPNKEDVLIGLIFPYFDGGASISRTARVFPTYLIFKPAIAPLCATIFEPKIFGGNLPIFSIIFSYLSFLLFAFKFYQGNCVFKKYIK